MTEQINKVAENVTNKSFTSKSIDHISDYKVVKSLSNFLLSFSLINYLYQQLASILSYLNKNFISAFPFIYNILTYVDDKIEAALTRIDSWLFRMPDLSSYSPVTVYRKSVNHISSSYLKPANSYIYNTFDKYFPATITENKAAFRLEELSDTSEISKFFKIVIEMLSRSKLLISNKSNEISSNLISNYNKEIESLNDKSNGLSKNVIASYNTGLHAIKSLNNEYIKPLKHHTQDYVVEVATTTKNKADSLISEAKQSINPKLSTINNKGKDLLNGSNTSSSNGNIPVSASA